MPSLHNPERHGCYAPYPWYNRFLMRAHTEIECDPSVWEQVDTLIRSKLSERGALNEDDHGEGSSAR